MENTAVPTLERDLTLGQLIAERPARTRVLEEFGISYCCRAEVPVADACAESGVDLETLAEALTAHEARADERRDWLDASPEELIDNILTTHHAYLRADLPRLTAMLDKLAEKRGPEFPWLRDVREIFLGLRQELELHMVKEEQILFPIIGQLVAGIAGSASHCGSVRNPIFVMEREHMAAKQATAEIRRLTNDYTPPEQACGTFRACIDGLAELEADLHEHIHKEDDLLFPQATELEMKLLAG